MKDIYCKEILENFFSYSLINLMLGYASEEMVQQYTANKENNALPPFDFDLSSLDKNSFDKSDKMNFQQTSSTPQASLDFNFKEAIQQNTANAATSSNHSSGDAKAQPLLTQKTESAETLFNFGFNASPATFFHHNNDNPLSDNKNDNKVTQPATQAPFTFSFTTPPSTQQTPSLFFNSTSSRESNTVDSKAPKTLFNLSST